MLSTVYLEQILVGLLKSTNDGQYKNLVKVDLRDDFYVAAVITCCDIRSLRLQLIHSDKWAQVR